VGPSSSRNPAQQAARIDGKQQEEPGLKSLCFLGISGVLIRRALCVDITGRVLSARNCYKEGKGKVIALTTLALRS
jgi:hypothetical protein